MVGVLTDFQAHVLARYQLTFNSLPSSLYIGLAVCSVTWNAEATVSFDNVRTVGLVTSTPYYLWASGQGISGANLSMTANPTGDGLSNLLKYAFNLNPSIPELRWVQGNSAGLPSITAPQGSSIRFEFIRRIGSGLTYFPEKSENLSTWFSISSAPVITPIDASWERVVHLEPWDKNLNPRTFGRVKVTQP